MFKHAFEYFLLLLYLIKTTAAAAAAGGGLKGEEEEALETIDCLSDRQKRENEAMIVSGKSTARHGEAATTVVAAIFVCLFSFSFYFLSQSEDIKRGTCLALAAAAAVVAASCAISNGVMMSWSFLAYPWRPCVRAVKALHCTAEQGSQGKRKQKLSTNPEMKWISTTKLSLLGSGSKERWAKEPQWLSACVLPCLYSLTVVMLF